MYVCILRSVLNTYHPNFKMISNISIFSRISSTLNFRNQFVELGDSSTEKYIVPETLIYLKARWGKQEKGPRQFEKGRFIYLGYVIALGDFLYFYFSLHHIYKHLKKTSAYSGQVKKIFLRPRTVEINYTLEGPVKSWFTSCDWC